MGLRIAVYMDLYCGIAGRFSCIQPSPQSPVRFDAVCDHIARDWISVYGFDDVRQIREEPYSCKAEQLQIEVVGNGSIEVVGNGSARPNSSRLTNNDMSNISVLSAIGLTLPAEVNVSGIDFSTDDTCIYFSAQVYDVCGSLINRKQELSSVRLDGTNQ